MDWTVYRFVTDIGLLYLVDYYRDFTIDEMSASLGYEGYSQSLSGPLDVRAHHSDSSSSDDDSSWDSDWETEHDGQVQTEPPVVKVSDGATRRIVRIETRCIEI